MTMKRAFLAMAFLVFSVGLTGCDACKENILDKIGDSVATMGKSGLDKNTVLAQRQADRAAKCAEQKGSEMKKKLGF